MFSGVEETCFFIIIWIYNTVLKHKNSYLKYILSLCRDVFFLSSSLLLVISSWSMWSAWRQKPCIPAPLETGILWQASTTQVYIYSVSCTPAFTRQPTKPAYHILDSQNTITKKLNRRVFHIELTLSLTLVLYWVLFKALNIY